MSYKNRTKKEKEIELVFPFIVGKEVKVWTGNTTNPYLQGRVEKWTGSYLVFEWLKIIHSDFPLNNRLLNSRSIYKIEIV